MGSFSKVGKSLLIFGISGLSGVLVDTDHAISLMLWSYIPTLTEGRLWHTALFIITGISICYMVSCLRGLYTKLVLISVFEATGLVLIYSPYVIWGLSK